MEEIMKNHEPKKHSPEWYETLSYEDTRYYGLFLRGKKSEQQAVWVDMKRFFEYFITASELNTIKRILEKN